MILLFCIMGIELIDGAEAQTEAEAQQKLNSIFDELNGK